MEETVAATVFLQLALWCLSSLSWVGHLRRFSPELVVPNLKRLYMPRSHPGRKGQLYYLSLLYSVGQAYGFEIQTLWNQLTEQQQIILYGAEKSIWIEDGMITDATRVLSDASATVQRQFRTPQAKAGAISDRSAL